MDGCCFCARDDAVLQAPTLSKTSTAVDVRHARIFSAPPSPGLSSCGPGTAADSRVQQSTLEYSAGRTANAMAEGTLVM